VKRLVIVFLKQGLGFFSGRNLSHRLTVLFSLKQQPKAGEISPASFFILPVNYISSSSAVSAASPRRIPTRVMRV
jgi:hypothetical protein